MNKGFFLPKATEQPTTNTPPAAPQPKILPVSSGSLADFTSPFHRAYTGFAAKVAAAGVEARFAPIAVFIRNLLAILHDLDRYSIEFQLCQTGTPFRLNYCGLLAACEDDVFCLFQDFDMKPSNQTRTASESEHENLYVNSLVVAMTRLFLVSMNIRLTDQGTAIETSYQNPASVVRFLGMHDIPFLILPVPGHGLMKFLTPVRPEIIDTILRWTPLMKLYNSQQSNPSEQQRLLSRLVSIQISLPASVGHVSLDKKLEVAESTSKCIICSDKEKTHALVPCGHYMYCEKCALLIKKCPCCSVAIERALRIYEN